MQFIIKKNSTRLLLLLLQSALCNELAALDVASNLTYSAVNSVDTLIGLRVIFFCG